MIESERLALFCVRDDSSQTMNFRELTNEAKVIETSKSNKTAEYGCRLTDGLAERDREGEREREKERGQKRPIQK